MQCNQCIVMLLCLGLVKINARGHYCGHGDQYVKTVLVL